MVVKRDTRNHISRYDTMMFINFCLTDHPERVSDELKAVAAEIRPGYTAGEELARNFAKAFAGMTVKELYDYAVEFGQKKTDSFKNMRYIDGFYLPMVEVVKYLYDNDFTVYVVSGTERTTTRAIVANSPIAEYVSPNHVIGTEFEVKVKGNEDVSSNMDCLYTSPSVAANLAHPILEEMLKELLTEGREFTFLCGHDANLTPVMSALRVEDYYLPEAIESTPVGSKMVFCRWKDDAGNVKISIDLVYQKTDFMNLRT